MAVADLTELRKALFNSDTVLSVDPLSVDTGFEQVLGDTPTHYVAVYSYTVGGVKRYPTDAAMTKYQIAVRQQGKVWVVVGWKGLVGP